MMNKSIPAVMYHHVSPAGGGLNIQPHGHSHIVPYYIRQGRYSEAKEDRLLGRKILFYINVNPWTRISEADILLRLSTDEDVRIKRLKQRYSDNNKETLELTLRNREIKDYKIKYSYLLDMKV
jgi:hypothetical protein